MDENGTQRSSGFIQSVLSAFRSKDPGLVFVSGTHS